MDLRCIRAPRFLPTPDLTGLDVTGWKTNTDRRLLSGDARHEQAAVDGNRADNNAGKIQKPAARTRAVRGEEEGHAADHGKRAHLENHETFQSVAVEPRVRDGIALVDLTV